MTIETFDPAQLSANSADQPLSQELLQSVLAHALSLDFAAPLELDADVVSSLAPLISHRGWSEVVSALTTIEIIAVIRLFTKGERTYSAWTAGAKSAVIALVKELRGRGEFEASLATWIKANSDNRYLPYGDLMDRL